jgi:ADP-ribose pyrophosphatase YjhB (NUDIX family)
MTIQTSSYPNTFYRVSIKAIIRNEQGEVLLVREKDDSWSLPGGGLDHGEVFEEALRRELYEEALITEHFKTHLIGIERRYVTSWQAWFLWIVFEVTFEMPLQFGKGADAKEVMFKDPALFKQSSHRAEQLVYKWCVDKNATVS